MYWVPMVAMRALMPTTETRKPLTRPTSSPTTSTSRMVRGMGTPIMMNLPHRMPASSMVELMDRSK